MFYRGEPWVNGRYAFKSPDIYGERYERYWLVNGGGEVKEYTCTVRGIKRVRDFVREHQRPAYAVLTSSYDWYQEIGDKVLGKYLKSELNVTVCKSSRHGWQYDLGKADILRNVTLTDLVGLALCSERGDKEAGKAIRALEDVAKRFRNEVYQRGMSSTIVSSSYHGMSLEIGPVKILIYDIAGRVMVTLWEGEANITFIADESDDSRFGLQSVSATLLTVQRMVETIIASWKGSAMPWRKMEDDAKVSFG